MRITTLLVALWLPLFSIAQSLPKLIAKNSTLKQIAIGYSFTEGPAVDFKGNVYFTDQPNNQILRWSTAGKIEVFMDDAGRANGLYFDNEGNLLACADEKNQLWKINPENKKVEVLVKAFEDKMLNGPNDLWVDPKGGIYFTDPFYKRPYWKRSEKEIQEENVYYLTPNYQTLKVVATDFIRPNGIIGTEDGKKLYVADINAGKTYSFTIQADGSLTDRTLFAEMGSDGMTLDNKGNLYLTGRGVTVFNKRGKKVGTIKIPQNWTANVTFGGPNLKTLFITAMQSVYTLDMKVRGTRWKSRKVKKSTKPPWEE